MIDGVETTTRAPGGEVNAASSLLNELSGMFDDVPVRPAAVAAVAPAEPAALEAIPVPEAVGLEAVATEAVAREAVVPEAVAPEAGPSSFSPPPVPSDPIIWKPSRRSFLKLRR